MMMFGKKKRYLYLSNDEHRIVIQALVKLKNALIQQGRSTDCVDELIIKFLEAPVRRIRVT